MQFVDRDRLQPPRPPRQRFGRADQSNSPAPLRVAPSWSGPDRLQSVRDGCDPAQQTPTSRTPAPSRRHLQTVPPPAGLPAEVPPAEMLYFLLEPHILQTPRE